MLELGNTRVLPVIYLQDYPNIYTSCTHKFNNTIIQLQNSIISKKTLKIIINEYSKFVLKKLIKNSKINNESLMS